MSTPTPLPPLPDEDFRRVLCVVAHPDDVEYGTSCAVASWTARGIEVGYLLLTRGEAGMPTSPERTAAIRVQEQVQAGAHVGVHHVEFLDHPDGVLEYGLSLRRDVARAIRAFAPDVVVAGSWAEEFAGGMLNQADHRVAGLVTLDAVRDAGNRWVFPELVDEGLQPHEVRWFLVSGDDRPTHGVAVGEEDLERGVASLEAHRQYLEALPWHPPARELVTGITTRQGPAMGAERAVLFRAWDFQAPWGS